MKNSSWVHLKVGEAFPKDVGRGLARMDPQEIQKLGIGVGDLIVIEGKRATSAKAMPTFAEHRGKGFVQIDGII